MIRFLFDQGLPRRSAVDLRELGHDVVHVGERGLSAATDTEIIDLASTEGRVVVTLDSDFAKILAARRAHHPSIIHLRMNGLDRAATTGWIIRLAPEILDDVQRGAIISVTPTSKRTRFLPLP